MDLFAIIESAAQSGSLGINGIKAPTEAQKMAGNYKMGRCDYKGMQLVFEQPRNSYREGVSKDGKRWRNRMAAHYGYIGGTTGADGDGIDIFVGTNPESEIIYVINQVDEAGKFDETKAMIGFLNEQDARRAYQESYDKDWRGLGEIVPATVDQFKWWLKYGDTTKPISRKILPYDGTLNMNEIQWDSAALPVGTDLAGVIYALRSEDTDGLLLDSVTADDILEAADSVLALDALVVPVAQLDRKMKQLQNIMNMAGGELSVSAMQVTAPFKNRGTTNVAAIYELSDGQTVSIYMHNPDTTPNKLMPTDDLVSWKWMLNKKDITILVAPEKGQDLNPREVARRVMRLAEKNSARFAKANANRAARMSNIAGLKQQVEVKAQTLKSIEDEIEQVQAKLDDPTRAPMPQNSEAVAGAAAGAGDKPAWELTAAEYVEQEFKKDQYYEEYKDAPEFAEGIKDSLYDQWRKQLSERALVGRISDRSLDDLVAEFGIGVLSEFRGQHQAGAENYETVETRLYDKTYQQVLAMAKSGKLGAMVTTKNIKQFHRDAIQNALRRGAVVPEKVKAEYPDIFGADTSENTDEPTDQELAVHGLNRDTHAVMKALVNLGWTNKTSDMKSKVVWYVQRSILGGFKGSVNPEGVRTLSAGVEDGNLVAKHGDNVLASVPYDASKSAEENAKALNAAVDAIPNSGVNASAEPSEIDTVDGMIINSGNFAGFKLVAQSAIGINSSLVNVKGLDGTTIGTVDRKDIESFISGNASVFSPADDWKTKFSNELKQKLGLTGESQSQAALPWDGAPVEDESRYYGTKINLTAKDKSRDLTEGAAMLINVFNGGDLLKIQYEGSDRYNFPTRINADDYVIQVTQLVDNKSDRLVSSWNKGDSIQSKFYNLLKDNVRFNDALTASDLAGKLADDLQYGAFRAENVDQAKSRIASVANYMIREMQADNRPEYKNSETEYLSPERLRARASGLIKDLDKSYGSGSTVEGMKKTLSTLNIDADVLKSFETAILEVRQRYMNAINDLNDQAGRADGTILDEKEVAEQSRYTKFDSSKLRMPTPAQLGAKVVDRKSGDPRIRLIGTVEDGGWTNGIMLDLQKRPAALFKAVQDTFGKLTEGSSVKSVPEQAIDKVVAQAKQHNYQIEPIAMKDGNVVMADTRRGVIKVLDARYVGYFAKQYPDAEFYSSQDAVSSVAVMKAGKLVGVIMPINDNADMKRALKARDTNQQRAAEPVVMKKKTPSDVDAMIKALDLNTAEGFARAMQILVAKKRYEGGVEYMNEQLEKGYMNRDESFVYGAELADNFNSQVMENGSAFMPVAEAFTRKDPLPLIFYFVGNNYESGERVFQMATGIKLLGLNKQKKTDAIYQWAGWTDEQIAAHNDMVAKAQAERAEKESLKEKEQSLRNAWSSAEKARVSDNGKVISFAEYILKRAQNGFNKIEREKKGATYKYSLTDGETWSSINSPVFNGLLKAMNEHGGVIESLKFLGVIPEEQSVPTTNPDREYLSQVIAGQVDVMAPDVADKLVAIAEQYAGDADMSALAEQAAEAYSAAVVEKAKAALA